MDYCQGCDDWIMHPELCEFCGQRTPELDWCCDRSMENSMHLAVSDWWLEDEL